MSDRELLPISALQHLRFCARQCALIHIERLWAENRLTAEGRAMHEKAHDPGSRTHGSVRIARAIPVQSHTLGLVGVTDVVEFHVHAAGGEIVVPVEYKRGKPKTHNADEIQLCAQALCLEEMFGSTVFEGALYYGQTKRRTVVAISQTLRTETVNLTGALHQLMESGRTPAAEYGPRCHQCSLYHLCKPESANRSASAYLRRLLSESG